MNKRVPLVSIGVPVYNGAPHLRTALDSLLAQDYPNLELIISDNASTDDTAALCEEYVARDPRIRYFRAVQNMGAIWNFNRAFELARGEYFMWAAADDRRDHDYVSRCAECLINESEAILCYGQTRRTGGSRAQMNDSTEHLAVDQSDAGARFRALLRARDHGWSTLVYGLIRRSAVPLPPFENYYGSDYGLLLRLCLNGPFVRCSETSLYYSVQARDVDDMAYYRRVVKSLHPQNRVGTFDLPYWQMGCNLLRIALTVPASRRLRVQIAVDILRYYFFRRRRALEVRQLVGTVTGLRRLRDYLKHRAGCISR